MVYRLIIFDLDGTILNTLEDLQGSLNHALGSAGLPERTLAQVRHDVGNGILRLVERSVPAGTPASVIQQVYAAFRLHYAEHCADKTQPYPGIPELLRAVRSRDIKTAVLSNKADFAVQMLCARFFPGLFDLVRGEREGCRKKPAPDGVRAILESLQAVPAETLYVGDSEVDIETARNAGLDCVLVDWGFRSRETLLAAGAGDIISAPDALLRFLG